MLNVLQSLRFIFRKCIENSKRLIHKNLIFHFIQVLFCSALNTDHSNHSRAIVLCKQIQYKDKEMEMMKNKKKREKNKILKKFCTFSRCSVSAQTTD